MKLTRDRVVIAVNVAIASIVVALRLLRIIDTPTASLLLVALLTPSILEREERRWPPSPPRIPVVNTPVMILALLLASCGRPMTPAEKAAAAEASYHTAHQACIEKSETIEDSRECRRRVREKWHRNPDGSRQP